MSRDAPVEKVDAPRFPTFFSALRRLQGSAAGKSSYRGRPRLDYIIMTVGLAPWLFNVHKSTTKAFVRETSHEIYWRLRANSQVFPRTSTPQIEPHKYQPNNQPTNHPSSAKAIIASILSHHGRGSVCQNLSLHPRCAAHKALCRPCRGPQVLPGTAACMSPCTPPSRSLYVLDTV